MNPCSELCALRYGHGYDPNLDVCKTCEYALAVEEKEKLAAEVDALKADIYQAQTCICFICTHYRKTDANGGEHSKHTCGILGDGFAGETLMCGKFEWRGMR